jgi:hypothetical protein
VERCLPQRQHHDRLIYQVSSLLHYQPLDQPICQHRFLSQRPLSSLRRYQPLNHHYHPVHYPLRSLFHCHHHTQQSFQALGQRIFQCLTQQHPPVRLPLPNLHLYPLRNQPLCQLRYPPMYPLHYQRQSHLFHPLNYQLRFQPMSHFHFLHHFLHHSPLMCPLQYPHLSQHHVLRFSLFLLPPHYPLQLPLQIQPLNLHTYQPRCQLLSLRQDQH